MNRKRRQTKCQQCVNNDSLMTTSHRLATMDLHDARSLLHVETKYSEARYTFHLEQTIGMEVLPNDTAQHIRALWAWYTLMLRAKEVKGGHRIHYHRDAVDLGSNSAKPGSERHRELCRSDPGLAGRICRLTPAQLLASVDRPLE